MFVYYQLEFFDCRYPELAAEALDDDQLALVKHWGKQRLAQESRLAELLTAVPCDSVFDMRTTIKVGE